MDMALETVTFCTPEAHDRLKADTARLFTIAQFIGTMEIEGEPSLHLWNCPFCFTTLATEDVPAHEGKAT